MVNIYKFHLCPSLLRHQDSNLGPPANCLTMLPTWLSNPLCSVYHVSLKIACRRAMLSQNTERLSVRGSCYYANSACIPNGLLSGAGCHEQSDCRVSVMPAAASRTDGRRCVSGENVAWCCNVSISFVFLVYLEAFKPLKGRGVTWLHFAIQV